MPSEIYYVVHEVIRDKQRMAERDRLAARVQQSKHKRTIAARISHLWHALLVFITRN